MNHEPTGDGIAERRRRELGSFLRRRRSLIRPEDVGVVRIGRRHVKGLRREEVAQLAGIGMSWYTLLEQGRVEHVGARTLRGIADALRLSAIEREHVFALARNTYEPPPESEKPLDELVAFIHDFGSGAAFMSSARSDVVAWNEQADRIFHFSNAAAPNVLIAMVRDPWLRTVFVDWQLTLRHMVGVLRSNYAYVGGVSFDVLVEQLREESPEFKRAWNEHRIEAMTTHVCALAIDGQAPTFARLFAVAPLDHPTHTITFLTPLQDGARP